MPSQPTLIIDTNVFIAAHNTYYAPDICPGFWDAMISHHQQGRIHSIAPVEDELTQEDTELSRWVEDNLVRLGFFRSIEDDSAVIDNYESITEWAKQNSQYEEAVAKKFAKDADSWLIAYAKTYGATVITNEASAPDSRNIIKIPDACRAFDVECRNTFHMLRKLGIKFTL